MSSRPDSYFSKDTGMSASLRLAQITTPSPAALPKSAPFLTQELWLTFILLLNHQFSSFKSVPHTKVNVCNSCSTSW